MNIDKKTCINIGIVTFLLYLAIHYWDGLVGLFNLFLAAAGTLINGAIIAYVLNILMRFYERHMAPNTKKKVWNAMRRPVCMALDFLTLVAVIVALIQIFLRSGASVIAAGRSAPDVRQADGKSDDCSADGGL